MGDPVLDQFDPNIQTDFWPWSPNHPNLFNPSTQIEYNVKEPCHVSLVIYNVNGQLIKKTINSTHNPGKYLLDLNMHKMSSGIYFYGIHMGDFQAVKKMIKIE